MKQNMVEAENFGREFVAMHIFKEMIVVLHYKPWVLKVSVDGLVKWPGIQVCQNQP